MISFIDDAGTERFLGNIDPGTETTKYAWKVYGDTPATPMVAKSLWPALILALGMGSDSAFCSPVHNQSNQGMCNASATCSAMESRRLKQGLTTPLVLLSGGDLYWRINGGSDRGSMLEDGLRESMAVGVADVGVAPYLTRSANNPGAAEARKGYRVLEAFLCPTFDHVMSAVLMGFDLISGVMWYNNYKTDGDGWLPTRGSGGGGGHAVHGFKPAMRGSAFGIWHKNSWTAQWGANGYCVFPEEAYRGPVGGWWCVRSVVDEGGGVPPLKV